MVADKEEETQKLVVFDLDSTLLCDNFIEICACRYNFRQALALVRQIDNDVVSLTRRVSSFLKDRSKTELVELAESIPMVPHITSVVNELRNRHYHIGIITDTYQFVSQIVARRIGADFELSNELVFMAGRATGEVLIPSYFHYNNESTCKHQVCKTNALSYICRQYQVRPEDCIVVGPNEGNECILKNAGRGLNPGKAAEKEEMMPGKLREDGSFSELLNCAV
jgi:phosphoserine phosphatase